MKRAVGIFLLACITFPFWGSYCWLIVSKQVIRQEVRQQLLSGMDKENLVLLSFTRQEVQELLRWEHEKEFEYKDQMYDIVETVELDEQISFWCYPDHQETDLNEQISSLVEKALGNHPQQREQQKRLINFLQITYLPNQFEWNELIARKDQRPYSSDYADCSSGFPDHPSPPPKRG